MSKARRGVALIMALVALALASVYIAEQTRLIMLTRRQQKWHAERVQRHLLTLAARQRADLQRQLSPEFAGETWQLRATDPHDPEPWQIVSQPAEHTLGTWQITITRLEAQP